MATSIILFYGMIMMSVACFIWTTSWLSRHRPTSDPPPSPSSDEWTAALSPSSSSLSSSLSFALERDITWIGSVWIPSPRMTLYTTTEIQQTLSRYDSIFWLGDKVSPFATLYHLLRHDNATGYLSRRKSMDETGAVKSTSTPCPLPWMKSVVNMTSIAPACHSIMSPSIPNNNINHEPKQRRVQRLDFVPTRCLFHLKQALSDWYSSVSSLVDKNENPPQVILIIIALGCDDVSDKARRRHACETPSTRHFPSGVWRRLDLVFQQLQSMVTPPHTTTTAWTRFKTGRRYHPHVTIVWRLGNYCQTHPERDGHVEEMDRRIQRGMMSLVRKQQQQQQQQMEQQSKRHQEHLWDILLLNHGQAIHSTAHVLNVETRLEHNFVFLQLLANYLQRRQDVEKDAGIRKHKLVTLK